MYAACAAQHQQAQQMHQQAAAAAAAAAGAGGILQVTPQQAHRAPVAGQPQVRDTALRLSHCVRRGKGHATREGQKSVSVNDFSEHQIQI